MARQFAWVLAAVLACTVSGGAAAFDCEQHKAQDKPEQSPDRRGARVKWWEDAKWRADLGITDAQSGEIKKIFEAEILKLRALREELEKREALLTQAMNEKRPNMTTITEQIDRVGAIHAEMYRTRTLMVFRMDRVLSADQRTRLRAMIDKADADRRKSEPNRRY